jgi:hypothetical protein
MIDIAATLGRKHFWHRNYYADYPAFPENLLKVGIRILKRPWTYPSFDSDDDGHDPLLLLIHA